MNVLKFGLGFFLSVIISYYLGYFIVLIYPKAYLLKDQGCRNSFKTFHKHLNLKNKKVLQQLL